MTVMRKMPFEAYIQQRATADLMMQQMYPPVMSDPYRTAADLYHSDQRTASAAARAEKYRREGLFMQGHRICAESLLLKKFSPAMDRREARDQAEAIGRYHDGGSFTRTYACETYREVLDIVPTCRIDLNEPVAYKAVATRLERIIRVSKPDTAAEFVYEEACYWQDDPFAPKVYGWMRLRDGSTVVEVERLRPYNYASADKDERHKYVNDRHHPKPALLAVSPFMKQVDAVAQRFDKIDQWGWDIHPGNLMFRKDQCVFTDPLYDCQLLGKNRS